MRTHLVTLAVALVIPMSVALAEKQGKEEKVRFEDLPAAVQATLKQQAGDGTIQEIEKEQEQGQTVYEAEVLIEDKVWEIEIAADGKLMSKELDDDGDDDGDDDDKNEKDDAGADGKGAH